MTTMLLEWVLTSVFLILTVLALRAALGKRMSAGLRYVLWAVVLVRLLVPVQLFTSPIAGTRIFSESRTEQEVVDWPPVPTVPSNASGDNVLSLGGQDSPSVTVTNFPQAPDAPILPTAPEAPAAPDLTKAPVWLGWAWLAGAAAAALVLLVSNLRFYWRLRRERIPLEGTGCPLRVYAAVGLPSPCLFGILRPAVYVTPEAVNDPAMLRHVLAHELTHYRHGDHIWSLLRCAALAAHWWNPLVWLAAVLSQRDAELACDEGALKRLGDGERAGYGSTLLALVTAKPRPADLFRCATTMAGDKKSLKERVSRIACAPKQILWVAVAAVLVTALACVCAFGQAAETEDEPEPDPSASTSAGAEDSELSANPSFSSTPKELADHFDVPEDVAQAVVGLVQSSYEAWRGDTALEGTAQFDGWRVLSLEGPWYDTTEAADLEIWRINYELHTTTPERVKVMSGQALSEDGWVRPNHPDCIYLLFTVLDGERAYLTDIRETDYQPGDGQFHADLEQIAARTTATDGYFSADLNRNGVLERIQVVTIDGVIGQRLEVWENDELLFSEEGYNAHAGYNALFLYTRKGEDYLLRYHPYMGQGWCDYQYQLFTLTKDGQEQVVRENSVEFDINFYPLMHQSFDPSKIADFMNEINGLLAHSVQLLNTDDDLLSTFQEEGRLYDSLWWLDTWAPGFVRDGSKSLLENLCDYQEAMEALYADEIPTVTNPSEVYTSGGEPRGLTLTYQGKTKWFNAVYEMFYPDDTLEGELIDLNGDGRMEIVFSLQTAHGTGCLWEGLHVFDAETLEEYDTSGVVDMILGQVSSYADEERFYVSAPGLKAEIEKPDINYNYNNSVSFGDYYRFQVKNGKLYGRFGAALDIGDLCYCGTLQVELRLEGGKLVCAGFEYLTADVD